MGFYPHLEYSSLRPDRVRGIVALSVPYYPRGRVSRLTAARAALGDGFYMNYFQKPGVAEAEFERDIRTTVEKFLYAFSGDVPPGEQELLVVPEGQGMLDHILVPEVLPAWLTEADITYYTTTLARTGFTGGFNWYRMIDKSWELMAPWHEASIVPPVLFIAGTRDPVVLLPSGQQQIANMQRFVPNLKATVLLPNGGHWIQQERAAEVSTAMLEFLQSL